MTQTEPRVGARYSCSDQSKMHGGNQQQTLPVRDGEVTLVRFRPDTNPDGPHIIDHEDQRRLPDRIEMLRNRSEPLPVYKRLGAADWEYLGLYRVQSITDELRVVFERSRICGRDIRYVIRLEEVKK